jgi:hypothetical protein
VILDYEPLLIFITSSGSQQLKPLLIMDIINGSRTAADNLRLSAAAEKPQLMAVLNRCR